MASVVGRLTLQPFGEQRTPKSIHLPIVRLAKRRNLEARDIAMIGLGDSYDVSVVRSRMIAGLAQVVFKYVLHPYRNRRHNDAVDDW